jgi:hypothetical protein
MAQGSDNARILSPMVVSAAFRGVPSFLSELER